MGTNNKYRKKCDIMRCALDLVMKSKEIEEAKKSQEEKAKVEFLIKANENALAFCEEVISPQLEDCAEKGQSIRIAIKFLFRGDESGDIIYPLEKSPSAYSNGKIQEMPNYNKPLTISGIQNHMNKYCYSVKIGDGHTTYQYNSQRLDSCHMLIIKANPECL